jgi:dipeptidyl aminopeptidase/acylaminoacyl peptidase
MEDTHIWMMDAGGGNRREVGGMIDNRQGPPNWAPDGRSIYFTVQERGTVSLYRLPAAGGQPEAVVRERGIVGSWAVSKNGTIAYALSTPSDTAQLYLKNGKSPVKLTDLNAPALAGKQIAEVESFTFISNDNKYEVETFLTKPLGMTSSSKHPLIVTFTAVPMTTGAGFQC